MTKYLGLFFLMLGVLIAVFLTTKASKIDSDSYLKAVISDKLIEALRYDR